MQPEPCMHPAGLDGDQGAAKGAAATRRGRPWVSTEDDGVKGERGEAVSTRRRGACSGTRMTDMDEEPDVNADEFGDNYGGRGQEAKRARTRGQADADADEIGDDYGGRGPEKTSVDISHA